MQLLNHHTNKVDKVLANRMPSFLIRIIAWTRAYVLLSPYDVTSFNRIKSLWLFSFNSLINWSTSGDNASGKGDPLGRGIVISPGFISSALVTAWPPSFWFTCWVSLSESLAVSASLLASLRFAAARFGRLLTGEVSFTESTWLVFGLLKARFSSLD